MLAALRSGTVSEPSASSRMACEGLVLDAPSLKDLEIFASESGERSLFQFCNLSRTEGGANVLRRRMERPWSSAACIRATQESLSFILARRHAFTGLPSGHTIERIERYTHQAMPIVPHDNLLAFSVAAFSLWANDDRHYLRISTGVQFTCRLIQALRRFVGQAEVASPVGELASLLMEMRTLLERPRLAGVPEQGNAGWAGKILRLDQIFRLHEKETITRLVELTYETDALVAMADVTRKHDFVMPQIEEGSVRVHAEGLVHPYVQEPVANSVELDQQHRVLFLTGPNMAGKTTYLRAFGTALYLAHLGMGVPARSFRFVPVQRLFSSISLNDDLHSGVSYFRAEALRIKAIAEAMVDGYRVAALLDEPFKGTNVKDAVDASLAILEQFARKEECLFMFSSHLIELSEGLSATGHIDYRYFEASEDADRLRFDYRLRAGVSNQRLGMRVLREERIFELLEASRAGTTSA